MKHFAKAFLLTICFIITALITISSNNFCYNSFAYKNISQQIIENSTQNSIKKENKNSFLLNCNKDYKIASINRNKSDYSFGGHTSLNLFKKEFNFLNIITINSNNKNNILISYYLKNNRIARAP